jgi:hypothetical protein
MKFYRLFPVSLNEIFKRRYEAFAESSAPLQPRQNPMLTLHN